MRASVLRDGRMVYRDDVPEPVPGPGQVLVRVRACGICGSDLHFAAHGSHVLEMSNRVARGAGGMEVALERDVFMGHEFSAEILDAGPDTETHPAGNLGHVASGVVVRQGNRPDRLQQQHDRRLRRADAALGAAADTSPERSGPETCRADRTHVGGLARRQQVQHPARRGRFGHWLRPDRHRHHRRPSHARRRNHCSG